MGVTSAGEPWGKACGRLFHRVGAGRGRQSGAERQEPIGGSKLFRLQTHQGAPDEGFSGKWQAGDQNKKQKKMKKEKTKKRKKRHNQYNTRKQ